MMTQNTITQLETVLAKIGAGKYGKDVTYAYCETGKYKPFNESTIRAAKARGYRVERRCQGVYRVYPKAAA